ncbi:ORF6N domain-containing protein [Foetidibacter luteolus]|uniref:ORF6N domain-containing protein n=1 Tax=Foetidibacter luteolus TaxID=2608880 RepID=UPI00129BB73D|nr:ORF6N domain-containing protein [Foetidibacter luteolus]
MLDRDLAEMYGVEVRALNQSVKRNLERFPEDFMFQLTDKEFQFLISQSVISKKQGRGGIRKLPYAFTEQGVAMLSSVLRSDTAIQVNIQIIRVFTKMKQLILENKEILLQIEKIEKKLTDHDEDLKAIFSILKKLINKPERKRNPIGFPYSGKK